MFPLVLVPQLWQESQWQSAMIIFGAMRLGAERTSSVDFRFERWVEDTIGHTKQLRKEWCHHGCDLLIVGRLVVDKGYWFDLLANSQ